MDKKSHDEVVQLLTRLGKQVRIMRTGLRRKASPKRMYELGSILLSDALDIHRRAGADYARSPEFEVPY